MSDLDFLKTDEKIEEVVDTLGGNGPLSSNVYPATIKFAYLGKSGGGANSLTVGCELENGRTYTETLWITSGNAKGCKPYYEAKDGRKVFLPGYQVADAICMLTAGKPITSMSTETKTLKIWDKEQKKEVPTEVECLVDIHGEQVNLGIIEEIVDKTEQDASGDYVPTGETRNQNVINKVFCAKSGHENLTLTEIKAKTTEPLFYQNWLDKNLNQTVNRSKGKADGATAGAPGAAPQPVDSLFA